MGNIFGILEGQNKADFCEMINTKESDKTEFDKKDLLSWLFKSTEDFKKLFNKYFEKNFKISSSYRIKIVISPDTHSSLFLAIFCSAIKELKFDNVFITGSIDFDKQTTKSVTEISNKFENVKTKISNDELLKKSTNLFLYISDKDENLANVDLPIEIKRFNPDTRLSEIVFFLQNSGRFKFDEKYLFENYVREDLNNKKNSIEEIDFFFTGEESSDALFSTNIFKQIVESIKIKESNFNINIYLLKHFSSQHRMNSYEKLPKWIEKFECDYEKINPLNEKMSLFERRLRPIKEMIIDIILEYNAKDRIHLNLFTVDKETFFQKNDEKSGFSAMIIKFSTETIFTYTDFTKTINISKVANSENANTQNSVIAKVTELCELFNPILESKENSFTPFVLLGFPAVGKSTTTLKFAQLENPNVDIQNIKIYSSDDRINESVFSDSESTKTFRSQFYWAYHSREETSELSKKFGNGCEYKKIEYKIRRHSVHDSINLAWLTHTRVDLGAKEILEPSVRGLLYKKGYRNILMLNAKTPLSEDVANDFANFKNTWEYVKSNLHEIRKNNIDLYSKISAHAFDEYFNDVFLEHPENALLGPRRNIFAMKNAAISNNKNILGDYDLDKKEGICYKCDEPCSKECQHWKKNHDNFKKILKAKIWDERFPYYLDFCTDILIRKPTVYDTALEVLRVLNKDISANFKVGYEKNSLFFTNDSGFAKETLVERFPSIFNDICDTWDWYSFIRAEKVANWIEGTSGSLRNYLEEMKDKTLENFFFSAKFLESEFFLYHIIKKKWEKEFPNKKDEDFFFSKKEKDWEEKKESYIKDKINSLVFQSSSLKQDIVINYIKYMTAGNSHDLSQQEGYIPTNNDGIKYLSDESVPKELFDFLSRRRYKRFDILCDNAGIELFSDYLFALYLLQTNTIQTIYLHLKPSPMFVSDATMSDYVYMKNLMKRQNETIYQLFTQYETEKRLIILNDETELFCTPYFSECDFIQNIMRKSELLILKGDLNFRRLVGDIDWNYSQSIRPIIRPFINCKVLCLRTIKSDTLLGLSSDKAAVAIEHKDSDLTKGKFATIQFI